jgi:hypothetical protein
MNMYTRGFSSWRKVSDDDAPYRADLEAPFAI